MVFKIEATTLEGKRLYSYAKYPTLKGLSSKADFINDAYSKVISDTDFIDTLTITQAKEYIEMYTKVRGNVVTGQVVIGTCKVVTL